MLLILMLHLPPANGVGVVGGGEAVVVEFEAVDGVLPEGVASNGLNV